MKNSLRDFKITFENGLLDLLWRQWAALGLAAENASKTNAILDPEALLLLTCTVARRDPRLFDEVLDWLKLNGWLINITRLKRMLGTETFAGEQVLSAVASFLATGSQSIKWKQVAADKGKRPAGASLFADRDGKALPAPAKPEPTFLKHGLVRGPLRLRGYSQPFRPSARPALLLQLRALFGISARAEIVAYLLTHEAAHPAEIGRNAYYFSRAIQGTLIGMTHSGLVQVRAAGREKRYWINKAPWLQLLNRPNTESSDWVNWAPLFSALEQIWMRLQDQSLYALDSLLQSSEIRQLMLRIRPHLERGGFAHSLRDDREFLGLSYVPVFIEDVNSLIEAV